MAARTQSLPARRGVPRLTEGRVFFAARTLLYDRMRLVISLGGMAFAVLLVLLLRGIMDGTVAKSTAYVDNVGADVFVAREGVKNMALSTSAIPETLTPGIASVPGVERASGVVRVHVTVTLGEDRQPAELVGYSPELVLGGPWRLKTGSPPSASGETALDSVLASNLGVGMGDSVLIGGEQFRVTGLSSGTASIAGKLVFVTLEDAQAILQAPGIVSFILVDLVDPRQADTFGPALASQYPGTTALTRAELSANDRDLLGDLFVAPINVMSTVGLLVGLTIVGLTMYTMTSERLRDFGVLKAIGAPQTFLLRTVMSQATALGLAGFGLGLIATLLAGPLVERLVPDVGVRVAALPALQILAAVVVMSLIGAVVPVMRILRVDPLLVFRR